MVAPPGGAWLGWPRVCVRTGVACVWLRAVCASVCVWNVLSVCVRCVSCVVLV